MKKSTFSKISIAMTLLLCFASFAQTYKPFSARKKIDINGKMIVVGNTILGKDNLTLNDASVANEDVSMQYIDIDADTNTFSSSSADLLVPKQANGSPTTCYKVAYAALYWGAMLQSGSRTDINKVKLKLPGGTTYNDVTGTVIYDAIAAPINPDSSTPYACFADVTSLLANLSSITGTFTVADVIASQGKYGTTGLSAGWTLFVIYEDPNLHAKSFTVFDGFSHVYNSHFELIPVTGFRTPPTGNIDLQFAYAALDGDKPKGGTKLEFEKKEVTTPLRPANNFFISTIENTNGVSTPRLPNSSNTLGYDTGFIEINGADPEFIKNNQNTTDFTIQVAPGKADPIFFFFSAYGVDIIAPKINLTKTVVDKDNKDIGGQNVTFNDVLNYVIRFQNVGNDNAQNFTIEDTLPINVVFNYPGDIPPLPAGITVKSYDPITRLLIFDINSNLVEKNDSFSEIRFKVKIVSGCNALSNACSNSIDNIAIAKYTGTIDPTSGTVFSVNSNTSCLADPKATNFLVGIDGCTYASDVTLCGDSLVLTAGNGYNLYAWSKSPFDPTGNPTGAIIGNSQSFTVTDIGTYYVRNTAIAPCRSITQQFNVTRFGGVITNPIESFDDETVICANDGKRLPNIYLCGGSDSRIMQTGIRGTTSIVWERLSGGCATTANPTCASESNSCTWTNVATGPDYTADTAGEYRLILNYSGGCFNRFYFNVYKNNFTPTAAATDIFCNTPGTITVTNPPQGTGYEYSLNPIGPFVLTNTFTISTPSIYTAYVRQVGVPSNPCIFKVVNLQVLDRKIAVQEIVSQPLCKGNKGKIILNVTGVRAQYSLRMLKGAAVIVNPIPQSDNQFVVNNLDSGVYDYKVTTDDGCSSTGQITIIEPVLLTATVAETKPLTCESGELTITTFGGTANYNYYVNGIDFSLNSPLTTIKVPVTSAGKYDIKVIDKNNCEAFTSITITDNPKPVYTISKKDILCYSDATGEIKFNVTAANGYALMYSIDGTTYSASPTFTGLVANTVYTPVLKYTLSGVDCFDTQPTITLTQPAAALTASAGVSELAGCGINGEGKIRITNPQGGVPPYEYNFNNPATASDWSPVNEAFKPVGTYTVYIRDKNGCTFPMPNITIDPLPVDPIVDTPVVVYNCDGTANGTITVTNPASATYDYTYSINGTLNSPATSNVFTGVPAGIHTITVGYVLKNVTTFSNLLNETFGSGAPTSTSGIAAGYCFNDQHILPPHFCPNPTRSVEDGQYSVANDFWRDDDPSGNNSGAWYHFKDHTTNGSNSLGRFLLVNIGDVAGDYGVLYSKPIVDVIPNQPIKVDLFVANLLRNGIGGAAPIFRFQLVDQFGAIVGLPLDTGKIAEATNDPNRNKWVPISITLNPLNNTNLTFQIRSGSLDYGGNDAVIDDVKVYQLPKACIKYKDIKVTIASNQAFAAQVTGSSDISCTGLSNGSITIAAQNFDPIAGFQYSKDGVTWLSSTTSPVTLTNLGAATYTPKVRYNAAGACTLTLTATKIIAPQPIVVNTTQTLATCLTGATVDATGTTGGTGAYTIKLRNIVSPFTETNFPATGILTNVAPGSYTVLVTDAKGCTPTTNPTITISAPSNPTASIDPTTNLCFDPSTGANIVVRVSGGVGLYTYKSILNGGTPSAASPTFSGPTFTYNATVTGTYAFEVYDSFGCKATTSSQIINDKLTANTAVSPGLDCDVAPANQAVITGTISGGTAPFTVTLLSGNATGTLVQPTATGTTFTYSIAVAGTYNFQIKDANNCLTTKDALINALVTVTGSATITNPTCFNGNNGQIQLAGGGGSGGGYEYNFNGAGFSATSLYTVLDAKTTTATTTDYSYQVKDSNGCVSQTYTATLNNPTAVVASASIPANTTCSATTVITSAGAGGAGGYRYSFNGSSTYTAVNMLTVTNTTLVQTITYSVKDSKGCIDTKTINIPAYNPITGINFSTAATITCLSTTTSVTLTPRVVSGSAVGPFTYVITAGPGTATSNVSGATSGDFTGLIAGNYTFQVTDANGCSKSDSLVIDPAATIAVSGAKTDETCFGLADGTAKFTVTGASAGGYTYTLSPNTGVVTKAGNVITVKGLGANTYTLKVEDNTTGCTSNTASVTINLATAIVFSTSATKVNCNNKISIISFDPLYGGRPGYAVAFVKKGDPAPAPGAYSSTTTVDTAVLTLNIDIYLKDSNDCYQVKQTIVIGQEDAPIINTPATQCYTGNPIAITITGTTVGTPTYSIDNVTYGLSPNFNLGVGSHTLYIKDGFGCTASTPYDVAPQLTISAIAATDVTCTPNTTINLSATGGTGAYTYQVSSNGGATYSTSTNPYITATAGTYNFKVTDAAIPACSAVSTDVIVKTKATVLTINTSKTDVKCFGDTTGVINITPTSGKSPYTYSITRTAPTAAPAVIQVSNGSFTGLIAGTYDILVTDALTCTSASTSISIFEPLLVLSASATAPPTTTCSTSTLVTVNGSGGTSPYFYSINGGAFKSVNTLMINDNGSDQLIPFQVRDTNGCITVSQDITVKKLNPPTISIISGTAIYCSPAASTTSTVTISTTNGFAPLAFVIVSGPTINTSGSTSGIFSGLTAGTYLFKVTDANGCSDTKSYTIDPVTPIDIKGQNISNVLCNSGKTGIAKYTVSGFSTTGNYTVAVTTVPAALSNTLTQVGDVITLSNLAVGSYTILVTDNTTGCSKSDVVSITEPPVLTLVLASNVNANCNVATSKVTVTAGGGTPGYTYAFMQNNVLPTAADYGPSLTANLNPTTNLLWDVWVKDAKGCETKLDVTIAKDPIPTVTASVQNQCTGTGSSFVIKAVGTSGVGPYTYTINTGVAPSPADTFTVAPGTYTITVKDANNCPNTTTVTVNAVLTAAAVLTKDLTCSPAPTDATIAINAGGGKGPYFYKVSSDGGVSYSTTGIVGNIFTTSAAGNYQFEVTDSNVPACIKVSNSVIINPITPPVITSLAQTQQILCNGDATAIIKVNQDLTKGVSPFTYTVVQTTAPFTNFGSATSGLPAGDYNVTVTDAKGCTDTKSITIVEPTAVTFNFSKIDIKCGGSGTTLGEIKVIAVGGGTTTLADGYTYYLTNNFGYSATFSTLTAVDHPFSIIDFGIYKLVVKDSNGCTKSISNIIMASDPNDLDITISSTPPVCGSGVDVTVQANAAVLSHTYEFAIVTSNVAPYAAAADYHPGTPDSYTFVGLTAGITYTFVVHDTTTDCFYLETSDTAIPTNSTLTTSNHITNNVTCIGNKDGNISFRIVNNYPVAITVDITYQLYDSQTLTPIGVAISQSLTSLGFYDVINLGALPLPGLSPGTYFVLIKEVGLSPNAGCSISSGDFTITESAKDLSVTAVVVNNEICSKLGTISAQGHDGTAGYEYQAVLSGNPFIPANWQTANSIDLAGSVVGTGLKYDVYVKDAYSCIKSVSIDLPKDPSPVIALNVPNKCAVEGAFSINVTETTAGVGPYSISVNSPNAYQSMPASYPGTPFTVTGLSSGLNDIYVKDSNGCFDKKSITIDKPLELTPEITDLPTCADNDGTITLTGTGGTSSYTYSILPALGTVSANVISGLPSGTYTVTMTDVASSCFTTASVELSKPNKPTFSTIVDKVTCFGSQDGIITVNLTGANVDPVYTYSISPIPAGSVQTDNVFSKLPAGTYTITVSSGRGCSTSDTNVVVGTPLALLATAAITDYTCNATNIPQPAKVTVNVTAGTGTGPYKYNFDGSANYYDSNELYVVDNGALQTVHFYVKDFNGCLFNGQVDVNPFKKITDITFNPLTQPTCPSPTQNVQLVVVGGYAITKYEILSPVALDNGTNDTFTLSPDTTYLFKVTDANGCSFQKSYTTSKLIPIAIVGELVNDISCNAVNGTTNNGKAKYTVTGFSSTGNYNVVVTPVTPYTQAGDVITLSNLGTGSYNVAVTDLTTGCTQNATVDITTPVEIAFTANATKVFCSKDVSEITVSGVTGGTGAYTYAVEKTGDPAVEVYTSSNILTVDTNLTALSWDVYVKDANGCILNKTVTVVHDAIPTITVPAQQCFTGSNLTVDLIGLTTVYGGVKTYTVDGSDIASSIATFTAPGTYKLGIRDDNGCEAFVNYKIENQLSAVANLTKDLYCATPINATINVVVTGGVGPYSTQLYSGIAPTGIAVGLQVVGSNFTASVATAGDYYFVTTDSNILACSVTTNKVTVTTPPLPVIVSTPITSPILCAGGTATMQVNVDTAIGLAPYTYTVTRTSPLPAVTATQVSNAVFTGLTAGTYDITVTDAKGCISATTTKDIVEPVVLTATVNAFLANTTCDVATVITVVGKDGTPTGTGYYYNFNNEGYTTSNTYPVNDNGAVQTITYTVKDANGCTTPNQTVTVNPLNKPTDLDFAATAITCKPGENVSTVILIPTNGVGTLSYTILPSVPVSVTQPSANVFTGLLPGDYTFKVTDSNGCSYQELYTVKDVVKIAVTGQLVAGVACNSEANGAVTFTVSGVGTSGFTNTITSVSAPGAVAQVGNTFELTNLITGTYKIDVTDTETGCISTFTVLVPEPAALSVNYATLKNANCKVGSTIQATANDGTPGYTYAFVKTAGPKVYTNSDTAILDPAFSWTVWAKDAHGCEASAPITINTDPMPTVTATVASQCASPAGYTINVVGTGVSTILVPLEYSLDGNSFQTATSFTVSSPGSYTVTVRDANQCTATSVLSAVILKPLGLQGVVSKPRSCSTLSDGEITLTASDGSGVSNYEYSKDGIAYVSSNVFSGLAAGTYTMYVRDIWAPLPYCVKSVQVIIDVPTLVTGMALTTTAVSCQGSSDGSITVALAPSTLTVNNNPDYNYSLVRNPLPVGTPVTILNQPSNVFDNLEAGSYTITTTSSRGCQDSKTITVVEPATIAVPAPVVVDYACSVATPSNTMNLATITVNSPTGGSGTYPVYEFVKGTTVVQSGASNVFTQTDLSGGTFTINVYDTKGCVGTTTATINPFVSIDFAATAITVTKAITCVNFEEIQVNVTTTGTPTPTLSYNVTGVNTGNTYTSTNPTGAFTGLFVGDYLITVTNPATGCAIQKIHYVNEPNTFDLQVVNKLDVICFGSNEGSVELTFIDRLPLPTDGSGPYSYEIKDASGAIVRTGNSTNAAPELITGLTAGIYSVTATLTSPTSAQCTTALRNFTINQPTLALTVTEVHTEITCVSGNNDGSILASATGGWPGGYKFQLEKGTSVSSPWSAVKSFNGLTAGTYTVKVRDSKGCQVFTTVVLNNPTPIAFTATPSTTLLACTNDTTASISVTAPTGGQGSNYLYTLNRTSVTPVISSGPQATPMFTNLGAGTYTITVQDGWGCSTTSTPIVITEPAEVKASLAVATTQSCLNNATIVLSATGGTGMYSYSTTANFAVVAGTFATTTTIAVPAGTYRYYVRDANGCTAFVTNDIVILPIPALAVTINAINAKINCKGDRSGAIEAKATGGLGNYIYTLTTAAGVAISPAPTQTSLGYFTDLPVGNYAVKVTSLDCNIVSTAVDIQEPLLALSYTTSVVNVTCNGLANGSITVNVIGGTGRINYAISPRLDQFFSTPIFSNLPLGTYQILIQDENGCYQLFTESVGEPAPLMVALVSGTEVQELCVGDLNAGFDVAVTGGIAPYKVAIDNSNGTYTQGVAGQTVFTFAGLAGGLHTVYVIDANTCTSEVEVLLEESVKMLPVGTVEYGCLSNAPSNTVRVLVDVSITNPADVDYALDGSTTFQASNLFNDVLPGFHTVTARHTNGCEQVSASFEVLAFAPLAITLADGGLNEIVATATGGNAPYQYALNGVSQGTKSSYIIRESGNYTVTVTDSNTCVASATRYFKYIDVCVPDHFTPNGDGVEDTWAPGCTINYKNLQFNVFDRYGRELAKYRLGDTWDGKYNGNELPSGDYWYVLKLNDSLDAREFVGHFTLYR